MRILDIINNKYRALTERFSPAISCPICLSCYGTFIKKRYHFLNINETERLFKCNNCKIIFITPFPDKNHIYHLYTSNDYLESYKKQNIDYIGGMNAVSSYLKERLKEIEEITENKGKILDVGAGSGAFLVYAQSMGWEVYGTEITSWGIDNAKERFNLDLFFGDLADAKFKDNFFDAVHLNHVLEHVYYPRDLILEIKRILRPGGYLYIEVPQEIFPLSESLKFYLSYKNKIKFLTRKILGNKIKIQENLPYSLHLFFFTVRSITRFLYFNKFRILKIRTVRRNKESDRFDYKKGIYASLIYSLEDIFNLGPNIEIIAKNKK